MVTVYAADIARLPAWQQRIWSGYNTAPEGGVSAELLSAQINAEVAKSIAPEAAFPEIVACLDEVFSAAIGTPLFRPHDDVGDVIRFISRFRALEPNGLFALAKDLIRIVADRIDTTALQKIAPPPKGERWGSIKSLEKYLATRVSPNDARLVTGPIAGAYQLRLADAHLPTDELAAAYRLARVDPATSSLHQGFTLISSVALSLIDIINIIRSSQP
jgi:hypothetical protein